MVIKTLELTGRMLPQAWQYYHAGELANAEALCRRVLATDPNQPEALGLLGSIAYGIGRLDLAIEWLGRAVQADPGNASYHNNLGVMYTDAGQLSEAVASYRQALRIQPDNVESYNNLSFTLYLLERYEEALEAAEQALRRRPDYAEPYNHRGLALFELGRAEEAEMEYRKAIRLKPRMAEAYRNLGAALQDQRRTAEAKACYEQALRLQPDHAQTHNDLGDLLMEEGRFDDAVAHLRESLRLKPDYVYAYWNLSQLAGQKQCRLTDEDLAQAEALLKSGRLSLVDASVMHLTLAEAHNRRGEWEIAFSHGKQGNDLRQEWLQQTGRAFHPDAHRRYIDDLIASFDQSFFAKARPAASTSDLPIFVVGMPRSGTTLVAHILSSHSQIRALGELRDISQLVNTLARMSVPFGGYPGCMRHLDGSAVRGMAERYLQRLSRMGGPDALRVVDKMPDNFLHLGLIAVLFPNARVVHCRRDPLDVCTSCYFQNFKGVNFSWSLENLGHYHRDYGRLMAHWRSVLPLKIFEVDYEDMVANQEQVSRRLVAFTGLPWEDRCLAFHKNPRVVQTASAVQVRQPIYNSSIGRWKRYAAQLEPLRLALGLPENPSQPEADLASDKVALG